MPSKMAMLICVMLASSAAGLDVPDPVGVPAPPPPGENKVNVWSSECQDFDAVNNPSCFNNVTWAMVTGQVDPAISGWNASNYPVGTTTYADYQCALYLKAGAFPGGRHNCTQAPCTHISPGMLFPGTPTQSDARPCLAVEVLINEYAKNLTALESLDEALEAAPWWDWPLLVGIVGGIVVVGAAAVVWYKGLFRKPAGRRSDGGKLNKAEPGEGVDSDGPE